MADDIKLGIDIGSSKIIAVLGYYNENNKWVLVDFERLPSKGILRGEIDGNDGVEAATRCLKEVLNNLKLKGHKLPKSADISIGGQYTKNNKHVDYIRRTVNTTYNENILNELNNIASSPVKNPNEEDYLRLLRGIRIDRQDIEKNPVGKEGKKFAAYYNTVFGLSSSINNLRTVFANCNLELNEVLLKPEVIANIVLTQQEKRDGVALIDIGAGTTSVIVYAGKMLKHVAIIPFGAHTITSDIAKKFKLSLKEAEHVKIHKGNAFARYAVDEDALITLKENILNINEKELARVIQYRVEEIIDSVLYQVHKSECKDKLSAGYVISGGGAMLKNFDKLLSEKDGKEVRLGYFDKDKIVGEKMNNLSFTTAIGVLARESGNRSSLKKFSKMFKSLFK
jgi:cell division protein FtsA